VRGIKNIIAFAKRMKRPALIHTSTCFVAGNRSGEIWESEPLDGYFPRWREMPATKFNVEQEIADCARIAVEVRAQAEDAHRLSLRVREALTAIAEAYHRRLAGNREVMAWFRAKYGIGEEATARLKIGYADNDEPSVARTLMEGPGAFTMRELAETSAFRPTAQDGLVPFFDRRIVFPYWSRGQVVFMIGRRTQWTPDQAWEKAKYKKLAVHNERDHSHVAPCIRNDVLYNEDALLARPERVVITEGVSDCISLMEHGFPAVSPVTVQIREADWERLLPKLRGVKTVFICQDNEVSEAGLQGALKTARTLAAHHVALFVVALVVLTAGYVAVVVATSGGRS